MQRFFTSSLGVKFGLALGRLTPPKLGYRLSVFGAKLLARRVNSPIVKAVRGNQFIIRGGTATSAELDQAVSEVFTHAGRCFVDLYHHLQNPAGLKNCTPLTPELEHLIAQSHANFPGAFIVAPHLSNFDLVLLAAAYRGIKAQVLTYGNPTGGYKIQNDIRAQTGLNITPVSPEMHRQAIENLRKGGLVITAIDRPIRRKAHFMKFFGQPCPLPAGHIRMALEAEVPIIVAAAEWKNDGLYHLHLSEPINLIEYGKSDETIRINGEAILRVIEGFIRKNPGQWLMYYPVWKAVGGRLKVEG